MYTTVDLRAAFDLGANLVNTPLADQEKIFEYFVSSLNPVPGSPDGPASYDITISDKPDVGPDADERVML
jgi:hypothetical protein